MSSAKPAARPCPVCGQTESVPLGDLPYALFDDLQMSGLKQLRQCCHCGSCFDWVCFSPEQLGRYYDSHRHYATAAEGGAGGLSADNQARYQRVLDLLQPGPEALILDYGCGQGGFLHHCQQQGVQALGLEPSLSSRRAGQQHSRIFSSWHSLQAAVEGHTITHLVLSHVLEHLLEPRALLQSLVKWAPQARFYLEVPEAAAYLSPSQIRWQELYFEHLSHFRLADLQLLAQLSGLGVQSAGQTPFSPAQSALCSYLVAETVTWQAEKSPRPPAPRLPVLPAIPIPVLQPEQPLALWGISQYAMLLLGSWPQPHKTIRLFDTSPAKVGRRILGLEIEASDRIRELSPETLLLLPQSAHLAEMKNILVHEFQFLGTFQEI